MPPAFLRLIGVMTIASIMVAIIDWSITPLIQWFMALAVVSVVCRLVFR